MKEENMGVSEEEEASGIAHFPDNEDLIVTSVEMLRKPKHRYQIAFGPYQMTVHEDVMLKYRLLKGNVFRKEELQEIIVADERQRAYVEALNHLSRKPRTAKEISQRLQQKGFEQNSVETTLERLEKDNLVDDALYAKMWAEQRMTSHKKGRLWVKQELRQKGIGTELISEALGEISADAELESALTVGRKKWQQTHGEQLDRKRKTGAYLMRRGFGGEQVRQVLKLLIEEDQQQGEWDEGLDDFE
ncbi:regulatory protein RecX [Paenibacillus glucanolyticus]|uniref:regulatory protein RecX n=1 Tax=Paenibacillus glucanolyticus TaxID=59843 RepID=UPI00096E185D|nr:RecX family transcriptional regulator [Paenibacillus glucanolyticus]OMF83290.1 RecX family transcriptional regulator [Paenibacillus glucanolyticus]